MSHTPTIRTKFDEIVAEMKSEGVWDVQRPEDAAFENMGAFGLNTMAYIQWLRHVFIPAVEARLDTDGPWPSSSAVGTQAIREFDGDDRMARLTTLLCEFDGFF